MNELKKPNAKRLLAWLLAIVMCVGLIPADAVFAEPEALESAQGQENAGVSEAAQADGSGVEDGGEEDAGAPEEIEAQEGETPAEGFHQVCFNFTSDFYEYGEEYGRTVMPVPHNGFATQMTYSNENRSIIGWKELGSDTLYDFSQPVTGDLDLYPVFDKYQLTFYNVEAGTPYLDQKFYVDAGQTFTEVPALPNQEHYEFEYWYSEMSVDQEAFGFSATEINQDYFFRAKWKRDFDYRVTFHLAFDFDEDTLVQYVAKDSVIAKQEFDNGKRKTLNWKAGGTEYDFSQPVTQDLDLYPVYDKYMLRFWGNLNGYTVYADAGKILTDVPTDFQEHSNFTGWRYWDIGDYKIFNFDNTEIQQDYDFYAEFEQDYDYLVEYCGYDGATQYLKAGEKLEPPKSNDENREIIGWIKEEGSLEQYDVTQGVTEDLYLYPIYDKYKLYFEGWSEDYTVYADAGKILADNLIPKDSRKHYVLKGWMDNEADSGEVFDFKSTEIAQDYYFTALWKRDFNYEVQYHDYGDATQYLKAGGKLEPPVSDDKNREIIGWTKEEGSLERYDVTQDVTEDLYLYPIYDKCRLVFWGNGIDREIYVDTEGYLIDVPQDSMDHHSFLGWEYWDYNEEEYKTFDFNTTKITRDYYFDAKWEREFKYQVTFNYSDDFTKYFSDNNMDVPSTLYLQEGEKPTEPEAYDNGTRKITGWTIKKGSNKRYDFSAELTKDFSLFPIMDKCRLKCGKKMVYVDYGSVADQTTLPAPVPDPEKEKHYTFLGWGKTVKEVFTKRIYQDYTFKEVWKRKFDCLVTFNFDSDFDDYVEENNVATELYLNSGDKVVKPPVYDNGKRKITGWREWGQDQEFDYSTPIDGDEDLILYPIYDKYRVTFCDYEEISGWNGYRFEAYVTPGGKVTAPSQVPDPYYTFKGWMYDDEDGDWVNFDFDTPVTRDIFLEAEWQPNFYTIDFYKNLDKENVYCWHAMGRVIKGQSAAGIRQQVGDPVVKGRYFAGWYYDEECTKPFNENAVLTKSIELFAKWGINSDGSSITPGNGTEAKVTSVTLSAAALTIPKGKSETLTVTTAPLKNAAITWNSSDTGVAEVSGGKITAKKAGEATVTATAPGGVSASCKVTVAEVKLNASTAVLKTGMSSTALKIESKYPANDTVASYKSSNDKIVKVNKKGKLTAGKKTGSATITVTMKSGAAATCKVTVQKAAVKTKKLTMNVKNLTMKKGKKVTLSVTRNPITATEKIKWSTSNKKVATVTSKGKVTAKKKGKATITAKSSNGKKATCKITVK